AWLEAAAAVAGALIHGRDGFRGELVHQLGQAERKGSGNVAFDAKAPGFQVNGVWDAIKVPTDIKGFVGRECGNEIVSGSFQLDGAVGEQQQRRFLWLGDDRTNRVPVRVRAGTSEIGLRLGSGGFLSW